MQNQAESTFSTTLPVTVFSYQPGQHPAEWREVDRGPGIFHLAAGDQAAVRARNFSDDDLEKLVQEIGGCNVVTFLNLSENRKITDEGMRCLVGIPQLTGINLSSCGLTDIGLGRLVVLSRLEHLNLSYCNRITDVGLRHLRNLTHLAYLDLQGCVKASQKGIAMLERKNLTIHA